MVDQIIFEDSPCLHTMEEVAEMAAALEEGENMVVELAVAGGIIIIGFVSGIITGWIFHRRGRKVRQVPQPDFEQVSFIREQLDKMNLLGDRKFYLEREAVIHTLSFLSSDDERARAFNALVQLAKEKDLNQLPRDYFGSPEKALKFFKTTLKVEIAEKDYVRNWNLGLDKETPSEDRKESSQDKRDKNLASAIVQGLKDFVNKAKDEKKTEAPQAEETEEAPEPATAPNLTT